MSTTPTAESAPAVASLPETETTLDELLAHPDGVRYELVDGRLVELNMGADSTCVTSVIIALLVLHRGSPPIARVFTEQGFACFPAGRTRLRRPDVAVILSERMTPGRFREGVITIRPDLAIEVVSTNDLANDLEDKLDDYRAAGIPLVWIIFPSSRRVRVIRLDGSTTVLGLDDDLTGEHLLPDFRCRVADIFIDLPEPSESSSDPER